VFGPQKGATSAQVAELDRNLSRFADIADKSGYDIRSFPGSGAAGGIGGMVAGILGASLKSGIELVMETVGLETQMRSADLVITAEGAIDGQSASGKTPAGVSALAGKHGVPVLGLGGKVGSELTALHPCGTDRKTWNTVRNSWPGWFMPFVGNDARATKKGHF